MCREAIVTPRAAPCSGPIQGYESRISITLATTPFPFRLASLGSRRRFGQRLVEHLDQSRTIITVGLIFI